MSFSSMVSLLLAFFICLQSFASQQGAGLFYSGSGAFMQTLGMSGLGGVWTEPGGGLSEGAAAPRYQTAEGQDESPTMRRIEPDVEEAQRALQALESQYGVSEPASGVGWKVTLPTPFTYGEGAAEFGPEERAFCAQLARQLEPLVVARGFVIRMGSVLHCAPEEELEQTERSLAAAEALRASLIEAMPRRVRARAERRFYSYCRWEPVAGELAEGAPAQLRIEVMLTKPFSQVLNTEGAGDSEAGTGT